MLAPRWTTRPPVGTPIDWGHPLAGGLALALVFAEGAGVPYNLVTGKAGSYTGSPTPSWGSGPNGWRLACSGTGYVNTGFTPSASYTRATIFYSGNCTSSNMMFAGQGSANNNFGILRNSDGNTYFAVENGSANYPYCSSVSGEQSLAMAWDGGATSIAGYLNGVAQTLTSMGGSTPSSHTAGSEWTVNYESAFGSYGAAGYDCVFGWIGRALSAVEVRSLHQNPWQLFLPRPWWYVASGGATYSDTVAAGLKSGVATAPYRTARPTVAVGGISGVTRTGLSAATRPTVAPGGKGGVVSSPTSMARPTVAPGGKPGVVVSPSRNSRPTVAPGGRSGVAVNPSRIGRPTAAVGGTSGVAVSAVCYARPTVAPGLWGGVAAVLGGSTVVYVCAGLKAGLTRTGLAVAARPIVTAGGKSGVAAMPSRVARPSAAAGLTSGVVATVAYLARPTVVVGLGSGVSSAVVSPSATVLPLRFAPRWQVKPPPGTLVDPGHPMTVGLRLFLPLNEGAGAAAGNTLVDVSPSTNTTTITGANCYDWRACPDGHGLNRNTTSGGYLQPAAPIPIAAGGSWTFLYRGSVDSIQGTNPGFWRVGATALGTTFCLITGTGRYPWIRVNGSDVLKPTSGAAFALGQFSTYVYRWANGSEASWWVDGQKLQSASSAVSSAATSISLFGAQNAGTEWIQGVGSAWAYWDRALSDEEVAEVSASPWKAMAPRVTWGGSPVGILYTVVVSAGLTSGVASGVAAISVPTVAAGLVAGVAFQFVAPTVTSYPDPFAATVTVGLNPFAATPMAAAAPLLGPQIPGGAAGNSVYPAQAVTIRASSGGIVYEGHVVSAASGPDGSIGWGSIDWYQVVYASPVNPFAATAAAGLNPFAATVRPRGS